MSNLAAIRASVRTDLHDENPSDQRWTDGELNRHIKRALREYSLHAPLESKDTLSTTADSRDVGVSSLTPRVRIVAVEHPTGEYPPAYVPFSLWGDTLTLDVTAAPAGVENADVYWHKVQDITESTSTFPNAHDDIIATGAAAFAALEWASFATNRVNVGGEEAWGRYLEFGNVRLTAFREELRRLPAINRARTGRLYRPTDVRFTSQTTDPGPV